MCLSKRILTTAAFMFIVATNLCQIKTNIMPLKDQSTLRNKWLNIRLEKVLPAVMKREGIDMWVVINREYNEDPVYLTLLPQPEFAARRLSVLIFFLKQDGKLEKLIVSKRAYDNIYKSVWPAEVTDQWKAVAKAIMERDPKKIGLDFSEESAFGDGLSWTLKEKLVQNLDKKYVERIVSAEKVAIGWLETRIPEEMEVYPHIVSVAHAIIAEAFSNKVIVPGVTTSDDVVWWMRDKISSLGLTVWFQPYVDIIRPSNSSYKNSNIIQKGDILHCDMGITYMGLNTDTQQLAYILKEGENDIPAGLKKGLADGNKLQDILLSEMKEGLTGNIILKNALDKAKSTGLIPSIYTHPLGYHGHGAGPLIGLYDSQGGVPGRGDFILYKNTCYSIELNVKTAVPEWNNELITFPLEQDAFYDGVKSVFLDKRQTEFLIIK